MLTAVGAAWRRTWGSTLMALRVGRAARLRPVRYLAVGGTSAVVDIVALVLLRELAGVPVGPAAAIGWAAGVIVNYMLSARVTFAVDAGPAAARRYVVLLALNVGVTVLVVDGLHRTGAPYLPVRMALLVVLAVFNYAVYSRWIFAQGRRTSGAQS